MFKIPKKGHLPTPDHICNKPTAQLLGCLVDPNPSRPWAQDVLCAGSYLGIFFRPQKMEVSNVGTPIAGWFHGKCPSKMDDS